MFLQCSLSGPLWLALMLFSSSLPQSLSSVVFYIPSCVRAFGSPTLFRLFSDLKRAGLPKARTQEGIQKTTEDRDCGKEDENSTNQM